MRGTADKNNSPAVFPCPVVIDTREQLPFSFAGLRTDARDGRRPLIVRTVLDRLAAADYSLLGFERLVAVERKSLADVFHTIGQGRGRFERELQRLAIYDFAAVVCEADWHTIVAAPPERSQLSPKVIFRSVIAWQIRFPTIAWWFCPGRAFAERATFRILEKFWKLRSK